MTDKLIEADVLSFTLSAAADESGAETTERIIDLKLRVPGGDAAGLLLYSLLRDGGLYVPELAELLTLASSPAITPPPVVAAPPVAVPAPAPVVSTPAVSPATTAAHAAALAATARAKAAEKAAAAVVTEADVTAAKAAIKSVAATPTPVAESAPEAPEALEAGPAEFVEKLAPMVKLGDITECLRAEHGMKTTEGVIAYLKRYETRIPFLAVPNGKGSWETRIRSNPGATKLV